MDFTMTMWLSTLLVLCISPSAYAQKVAAPPSLTPTPAPAPGPGFVNITELLTVAGPFHTFLHYLQTTKVIETFQNQANDTEEGITLFVPTDRAFATLKKSTLSNLTKDQIKSICLFHALPHYYSLAEFKNLSMSGPIPTFAGNDYSLNFTDKSGSVHLTSGWANTKVSSAVFSTDPVAIYQVDKVLLPEAIFGTDIPPTPAPAPAPEIAPAADTVADKGSKGSSPKSSPDSAAASPKVMNLGGLSQLVLAVSGGLAILLL